jgi:hypothetical protein
MQNHSISYHKHHSSWYARWVGDRNKLGEGKPVRRTLG